MTSAEHTHQNSRHPLWKVWVAGYRLIQQIMQWSTQMLQMFTEQPQGIATQPKFQAAITTVAHNRHLAEPNSQRQSFPVVLIQKSFLSFTCTSDSLQERNEEKKTFHFKAQIYSTSLSNPLQMQSCCSVPSPPVWNTVLSHTMKDGKQINTGNRKPH